MANDNLAAVIVQSALIKYIKKNIKKLILPIDLFLFLKLLAQ